MRAADTVGLVEDPPAPGGIFGRDQELAFLNAQLDAARDRSSRVVVITGPAGIGKTSLLDEAFRDPRGFTVVRIDGVETESGLAYSALHRLLAPFLPVEQPLPAPQQQALDTVFGVRVLDVPDPFLVGLAALTVLTDAARRQPLICVIDDVHWMDEPSLLVMAFVARRVFADPIVLAFATRPGMDALAYLAGLPPLSLTGLEPGAQVSLLQQHAPTIRPDTAQRIVDESAGNPLALVEYVRNLSPHQLSGEDHLDAAAPLTMEIEDLFDRDIRALPEASRLLLTTAALEPRADFERIRRSAKAVGVDFDSDPERALGRLATVQPRVSFSHPLVRSAAYRIATTAERRRIHAALAEGYVGHDPVRRAWHLARATDGPDEAIARELEDAAAVARTRGGYGAESELLGRAVELTADARRRDARLLRAVVAALLAGQLQRAERLLAELHESGAESAAAMLVRAKVSHGLGRFREAPAEFIAAARALQASDPAASRDAWHHALHAAMRTDGLAPPSMFDQVAAAAAESGLTSDSSSTFIDLVAVALVRIRTGDRAAGFVALQEAYATMRLEDRHAVQGMESALVHLASVEAFDLVPAERVFERLRERDRAAGAAPGLRMVALTQARNAAFTGRLADAHRFMDESTEMHRAHGGDPRWETTVLYALAFSGREAECEELYARIVPAARAADFGGVVADARSARGVLYVGARRYADAVVELRATFDVDYIASATVLLPTVIEAAVRAGDDELAQRALERLHTRATAAGTPWAGGLLTRAQALTARDDDAEPLYQRSLASLETAQMPLDLARSRLVYGEWLRRRRRHSDAMEQLGRAHDELTDMGAAGFAERARVELEAAGGRARRRSPETRDELTAQERQVAFGAASGATNREIAATMFISEATVAYHMRRVFQKVGVSSRRQLRGLNLT